MRQRNGIFIDDKLYHEFEQAAVNVNAILQEAASKNTDPVQSAATKFMPNPDPVLKKKGKDIEIYTDLLYDTQVGACADNLAFSVKKYNWSVGRGLSSTASLDIVRNIISKIPRLEEKIDSIIGAMLYGYAPHEILYTQREDGYIGIKDIKPKPHRRFKFNADDKPLLLTKANKDGEDIETLYPRKFLIPRVKADGENPYGRGLLARCFWAVALKAGDMRFWAIFTEAYAMPRAVIRYPAGMKDEDIDTMVERAAKTIQDGVIAIADNGAYDILKPGSSDNAEAFEKLKNVCDADITKAILGHNAATDSVAGSLGGDNNAEDSMEDRELTGKALVESFFNDLLKWIYEINFPGEEPAVFELYNEAAVNLVKQSEIDVNLFQTGVRFTPKYYTRVYGLLEDEFTVTDPTATNTGQGQLPTQFEGTAKRLTIIYDKKGKQIGVAEFLEIVEDEPTFEDNNDPVQQPVDNLLDGISDDDLRNVIEQPLSVIFEAAKNAKSLQEFRKKIPLLFEQMDTKDLADMLGKTLFLAQAHGNTTSEVD